MTGDGSPEGEVRRTRDGAEPAEENYKGVVYVVHGGENYNNVYYR